MSTLNPRSPYSTNELATLYPPHLQLKLVQIFFRHGERTPTSARFQNIGLPVSWPYCSFADQLIHTFRIDKTISGLEAATWRNQLETLSSDSIPVTGDISSGQGNNLCGLGELTDKGRETTLQFGRRLRHLYINQLGFMPTIITDPTSIYIRASPFQRAQVSAQQAFLGLYPPNTREKSFGVPVIITRDPSEETILPNEDYCPRLTQLMNAFTKRTADKWNTSKEVEFLNKTLQPWLLHNERIAVDSQLRIHSIFDIINATLATENPATSLPAPFYDSRVRKIMDTISLEEEYGGYKENAEYRVLGIGSLCGDITKRMMTTVAAAVQSNHQANTQSLDEDATTGNVRFALVGCHDSTIAATLASLQALEGENATWPSYTASLAIELFQADKGPKPSITSQTNSWGALLMDTLPSGLGKSGLRTDTNRLSEAQKQATNGWYVRLRYNERVVELPGCSKIGDHLDGEKSFCTLARFKSIIDEFTSDNWKKACYSNLDKAPLLQ